MIISFPMRWSRDQLVFIYNQNIYTSKDSFHIATGLQVPDETIAENFHPINIDIASVLSIIEYCLNRMLCALSSQAIKVHSLTWGMFQNYYEHVSHKSENYYKFKLYEKKELPMYAKDIFVWNLPGTILFFIKIIGKQKLMIKARHT